MDVELEGYMNKFTKVAEFWHNKIMKKLSTATVHKLHSKCQNIPPIEAYSMRKKNVKVLSNEIRKIDVDSEGNLLAVEHSGGAFLLSSEGCLITKYFDTETSIVVAASFSPNGNFAGFADIRNEIMIHNLREEKKYFTLTGHKANAPEIRTYSNGKAVAASSNGVCLTWDFNISTSEPVASYYGGESGLQGMDDKKGSNGQQLVTTFSSGFVKLFDARESDYVLMFCIEPEGIAVKYFPDNLSVLIYHEDNKISLVDLRTGREVSSVEKAGGMEPAMETSSSGRLLFHEAQGSGQLDVFDLCQGQRIYSTEDKLPESFTCLKRSADGGILFGCYKKPLIRAWH